MAAKKKTADRKLAPVYSGPRSRRFWAAINALPVPENFEAYSLGVVLQNVEADVLRMIDLLSFEEGSSQA